MPALEALSCTPMAPPPRAAPDEILTIRPHLRARIMGSTGLRAQERRFQVHRDGAVEIILGQIIDAAHDRHARIVDENVDRTERGSDLFDQAATAAACETSAATAMARPPPALIFATIASAASSARDNSPRPRRPFHEPQRNRRPDATGRARHQRDMRAQILSRHHRILRRVHDGARAPQAPYSAGSTASAYSFLKRAISSAAGKTLPTLPTPWPEPQISFQAFGLARSPERRCRSSSSRDRRSAGCRVHAGRDDRRLQIIAVHAGEQIGIDDVFGGEAVIICL